MAGRKLATFCLVMPIRFRPMMTMSRLPTQFISATCAEHYRIGKLLRKTLFAQKANQRTHHHRQHIDDHAGIGKMNNGIHGKPHRRYSGNYTDYPSALQGISPLQCQSFARFVQNIHNIRQKNLHFGISNTLQGIIVIV